MSGIEVIGAISSVAQLVDLCFRVTQSLFDLLSTVRRIPEVMKQRRANVEQLQEILRMIRDCPVLQTANIGQVLGSMATKLQTLRRILQKLINTSDKGIKKHCRALFGAIQEKRIISLFNELESDKTMLILCIVNVDSSLLHLIDSKFSGMAAKITEVSKELPNIQDAAQRMRIMLKAFHEIPARTLLGDELPCRSNGDTDQNRNSTNVFTNSNSCSFTEPIFNNTPPNQISDFVGRDDLLAAIYQACTNEGSAMKAAALVGMGGSGKTQLAMKYCRSRFEKRESIFWTNASNPARLEQSYGALANLISRDLHPGITFLDSDARIHYVKDTLRSLQRHWILVLDNYDDPSQFDNIRYYLPDSKLGFVITTSRHLDSTRLGVGVEVRGMGENDSLELLLRRSSHQRTEANEKLGKSIVRRLGYLPLAIDQAGSYMRRRKLRLGDFLDHYGQRRESVLRHTPHLWDYRKQLTDGDGEAVLSVFTTWELSFEQLSSSKRPELMQLVSLFGFFYHESISEALFQNFGDRCGLEQVLQLDNTNSEAQRAPGQSASWGWMKLFLNEAGEWSSISFGDALADLSELFLIENFERQDDGTTRFSIHPLVSDWIKLRNKDDQTRRRYSEQVIRIMTFFLETNHPFEHSPQTKKEILAHLDECLNHDKDFFKNDFRLGRQSLRVPAAAFAKFYCEQGRYKTAVELYQRVLDDETRHFGQDHIQTLETMHNLGCVFHSQGQYIQAKDLFRQALSGREARLGDSHLQTLWTAESLANIFRSEARYVEAEQLYSRVLNGRLGQLQDGHPDILRAVANLASIHRSQGRYESARGLYQQAAALLEVQTCQIKYELSWISNDIANFLQSQSQFIEAAQLYEAVLSSREKLLGCSHPDTLWTVADLANNYRSQKRYQDAEALYDRALNGLERQLGRDHPETLWAADGLAHVYCCQDRFAEARAMFQRALAGREVRLGPDHHNTLRTVHGLADVFHREGNFEESERLYNRALKGLEKQLGKDHPKTLAVVEKLATNYLSQRNYEMAETLFIRTLNGRLHCLGRSHPDTLQTNDKLTSMYKDLGRDWNAQALPD